MASPAERTQLPDHPLTHRRMDFVNYGESGLQVHSSLKFTSQCRSARLDQLDLHSEKTEPCSLADPADAGPVPLPSNLTSPTEDVTSFVSKHHDPWIQ